jgi:hypothetical protein
VGRRRIIGWAFPSASAGDYLALTLEAIKGDQAADTSA